MRGRMASHPASLNRPSRRVLVGTLRFAIGLESIVTAFCCSLR
ncbi:hypothetical protein CCHR01_18292 [Colletotrichum chrysophilum]|uniref:Uncharacterized protein n=1 Tax=Colletotrichum chrysophilum TaxID=1836956 RepID=A0AAD9A0X7_9PEZI|nr:hypothetical protein CCHR01_18292 [Colletotrichum chrysophilum]